MPTEISWDKFGGLVIVQEDGLNKGKVCLDPHIQQALRELLNEEFEKKEAD